MKTWKLTIVFLVALWFVGLRQVLGEQSDLQQRLAVDLSDGSHVVGASVVANITIHASFGKLSLPLTQIASVTFGPDNESVIVAMDNGDRLSGIHSLGELQLTTMFGNVAIPAQHIRKLVCLPTRMQRQLREGLMLYFSFDGNIKDTSGKENEITTCGVKLTEDRNGRGNSAAFFNGESYIEVKSSPSLELTKAVTIAAWVKHEPSPQDANKGTVRPQEEVVCKMNTTSPWNRGFRLTAWWSNPNGYALELYDGSQHLCTNSEQPMIEKWTHVAASWDGKVIRMFLNGKLKTSSRFEGTISDSGEALLVGMHTLKNQAKFRGVMDELRIYNRALSIEEVESLLDE